MAKSNLRLVPPDSQLRTVTLRRRSNRDMGRDREHLTELEVERLIKVAKGNRHGQRDATMILIGFRHGLRVSELCDLQWPSIAFETGTMHVRRAKGGEAATHPLLGDELRALRELKRQSASPFLERRVRYSVVRKFQPAFSTIGLAFRRAMMASSSSGSPVVPSKVATSSTSSSFSSSASISFTG